MIDYLQIENYKSLRHIEFEPGNLTVVIGANGSGKSNLADCFDFVSEVYKHSLPIAVARKGGYENIAHRKIRRSKGLLVVDLVSKLRPEEIPWIFHRRGRHGSAKEQYPGTLVLNHRFEFRATGTSIRAGFTVESELIHLSVEMTGGLVDLVLIERQKSDFNVKHLEGDSSSSLKGTDWTHELRMLRYVKEDVARISLSASDHLFEYLSRFVPLLAEFSSYLGNAQVFQLSPTEMRRFGVPIPQPEMGRFGDNLPAVVDLLVKDHKTAWRQITTVLRRIIPGLERVEVNYTHSRTLGLYFVEKGVGRPWTVEEVSDGTIHTLALLVAIFDPRSRLLVIEEPENSIHAWILRSFMDAAEEASRTKQVIITTHSESIVNRVQLDDLWVIWRSQGRSGLARASDLEPDLAKILSTEGVLLSELLDSGAVVEAVPPGPID